MKNIEFFHFYKYIHRLDDKEYLYSFLQFNLAPTISGLKASTLINLKSSNRDIKKIWNKYKKEFSEKYNIDYFVLKKREDGYLILFYEKNLLIKKIFELNRYNYLVKNGYENCLNLIDFLDRLKQEFINSDCPKEIGIFLDYPLEDVMDFNTCRKCKCVGYWKCYNDDNHCKKLFKLFDKAKIDIANNILNGKTQIA